MDFNFINNGNTILYSTDCPKCKILEKKLDSKHIKYNLVKDKQAINAIKKAGFMEAPLLKVNDQYLLFGNAIKLINSYN